MAKGSSTVFVIDDDASVREAVTDLLESVGMKATVFASTEEFLSRVQGEVPSCLVLDIRLPGMNGLEFQEELRRRRMEIPIVFITAHGDVRMTSRAFRGGAVEFLTKPFQKDELLAAIGEAVERDAARREQSEALSELSSRFSTLTARERQVMALVTAGLTNKQAAAKLGVQEITIKVHRARVMEKMQADSLPELVRLAEKLKN